MEKYIVVENRFTQDTKYNPEPIDLEHPLSSHDFQIILIGREKRVLEFGVAPQHISKILKERGCHIMSIEINSDIAKKTEKCADRIIVNDIQTLNLDEVLGAEKYDIILMADFLSHLIHPTQLLKKIRKFLDQNGSIVCTIQNIAYATIRLKLLNGKFGDRSTVLPDEDDLRFFTLDTILYMLEVSGYSVNKLFRVKKDINLDYDTDLKRYTIPEELINSILRDPEATTFQYVFSAIPSSNNSTDTKWLMQFPKNITTDSLKEILRYYKLNLVEIIEKRIQERDSQKIVDYLYREILNRPPDMHGLEYYRSLLESGKMTIEDVIMTLIESDERKITVKKKI